ncbi:hypothetical protein ACFW1A_36090 [Kitasatospora sp. NPDC058965]|uniref:hypothetical protein n=1 Tax=Kitasatospora sp. NPDC058965 TaxID=3346682 RepID=UPI003691A988
MAPPSTDAPADAPTAAPAAGASTPPAGNRVADACSVLTNDQVTGAMGASTPLLAEGSSPDKPWGCTWGSRQSYVSLEELDATRFATVTSSPDLTGSPVGGIGDSALLVTYKDDGRSPQLVFTVAGHHYSVEAVASRSELGAANAAQEAAAEQQLAGLAARALAG